MHKGIYMESTNLFYIYIVDMQVLFIQNGFFSDHFSTHKNVFF